MISNLYFCIISTFYSILLLFNCIKRKNTLLKHKIFNALIITNFIGILIGFGCFFTVLNYESLPVINYIVSRLYLVYLLVWLLVFTSYIFVISYNVDKSDKKFKILKKIMLLIFIVLTIVIYILPLNYVNSNNMVYSYGPATQLISIASEIFTMLSIVIMFLNSKNFDVKKYSPLFIYIAGGILVMLLQSVHPELLLISSMEVFVTYMIYFSIENNDKKAGDK